MMIKVENLSVNRGKKTIIEDLAINIKAGELTVIIGPNGSGKTTLLSALCGELQYSGDIYINGQNTRHIKAWQLACQRAVLPQASTMSFPFLVREVVAIGLSAGNGRLLASDDELIYAALSKVDLVDYHAKFYQELSGGEQARVQLARVLCQIWQPEYEGKPCWLMLDEPVAALDIEHQLTVMNIAKDFVKQGGGVIAILHDLNLAARYADHLILMQKGKIAAKGIPQEVITAANLQNIYNCYLPVNALPPAHVPFILPQADMV